MVSVLYGLDAQRKLDGSISNDRFCSNRCSAFDNLYEHHCPLNDSTGMLAANLDRGRVRSKCTSKGFISLLDLFGSFWIFLDLFGSFWIFLDLFGSFWIFLDLFGSFWIFLDLFGSFWIFLDLFGSFWIFLDLFGSFWIFLDLFGSFWIFLDLFGSCGLEIQSSSDTLL